MYKMIVSDFFGTLINSEEAISLSTMIELDRIRKKGVLFCVTTTKSARTVIEYNRDFPFIDYVVAFNGGYVYDLNKKKALYDKGLTATKTKKICKLFSDRDMCFYTLDKCNYTGKYRDNDYSEMIINLDDFIEEMKSSIYKVKVFFENKVEAKKALKLLEEDDKLSCYLKEEKSVFVIEIYNAINSKLSGVEKIVMKNKLNLKDVLAVCSSSSSCTLAKKVGCSFVVKNGDAKLRKLIKNVTGSNEEKGVEQVIKKCF